MTKRLEVLQIKFQGFRIIQRTRHFGGEMSVRPFVGLDSGPLTNPCRLGDTLASQDQQLDQGPLAKKVLANSSRVVNRVFPENHQGQKNRGDRREQNSATTLPEMLASAFLGKGRRIFILGS